MRSLRASVSVIDPVVGVQASVAASEVAYILLSAGVRLDTSGRFRFIPELVIVSEAVSLAVSKTFTDNVGADTDQVTIDTLKGLSDSVSFTEVFVATLVFLRDFSDTVDVPDAVALSFVRPLADDFATQDADARSFSKFLASGFAMNDSFDAGDGSTFAFSKGVTNVVFAPDVMTLSSTKGISDMIEPVDAGSLLSQGYCDLTYFAEDYVGESRTFS